MKKVSIITVNFNQSELTREFLGSICKFYEHPKVEIIVVDNGSVPNLTNELSKEYPEAIFIRSEQNLGFAGGNNLGIQKGSGDYYFLVNNDTEFTEGLVESLSNILDDNPNVGIVSPKILYFAEKDKIQYAGYTPMNFITGGNSTIGQYETDRGQYDHLRGSTAYAHGAAMMVRREAVEKAGLMPEIFFLYFEEFDWCEMIRNKGYEIWIEPKASIYHKDSISTGKNSPLKEYYMIRNRILFMRRNAPSTHLWLFYIWFALLVVPKTLFLHAMNIRMDLGKQLFRAVWWNFKNGSGV